MFLTRIVQDNPLGRHLYTVRVHKKPQMAIFEGELLLLVLLMLWSAKPKHSLRSSSDLFLRCKGFNGVWPLACLALSWGPLHGTEEHAIDPAETNFWASHERDINASCMLPDEPIGVKGHWVGFGTLRYLQAAQPHKMGRHKHTDNDGSMGVSIREGEC